jgi:hypothetical protein
LTLFSNSTKRNRDIAARPALPYGKMHPARPGEYLLMDTTHLDVFAIDPHTLRWVDVDLTVGMDWYSRCITGLRLTPVSTKAIDAASVLDRTTGPHLLRVTEQHHHFGVGGQARGCSFITALLGFVKALPHGS